MFERQTGQTPTKATLLAVLLWAGSPASAGQAQPDPSQAAPHAHNRAMLAKKQASPGQSAAVKLLDHALLDQDGNPVRFGSEVIGERIVVMDFVYTTCTTVCPVLSAILGQVQDRLGERLGKDVFLVSVSVDPTRDSPARLKAYAGRYKARTGWTWLTTGEKPAVDRVLDGLGAYTPNFEDHPSMVLVGDGRTDAWTRFFGFPSPNQILARVDELIVAREIESATVAAQE